MDLATLIGLFGALGVILWGILLGSSLTVFIDIPSVLIVVVGSLFASSTAFRLKDIGKLPSITKNAFLFKSKPIQEIARDLIEMSIRARKEGLLALESVIEGSKDPFMAKGIQLVVDGHEVENVDRILSSEIDAVNARHRLGADMYVTFATFAPALGMIGTLIGLVQMLQNMSDPSAIGPAMAVALITTFYGAILANVVFMPMASKLTLRAKEESAIREMILSGILAISNGDNPRIVEQKLNAYLEPRQQIDIFGNED
jgi:chemotaxis protein MotA